MSGSLSERFSGYWSFALAASAAPLSYIALAPCGVICGSCPLGGACFAASPLMFGTVIVIKFGRSIKWRFQYAGARLRGKDPPPGPVSIHHDLIEIDDLEDDEEAVNA